jgi:hypothetical protein
MNDPDNTNDVKQGVAKAVGQSKGQVETITIGPITFHIRYSQCMTRLTDQEYDVLREDIAQRGILLPIIVDETYTVIDGYHRLLIAKELGLTQIPFQVRPSLSEEDKWRLAEDLNLHRRHLTLEEAKAIIDHNRQQLPAMAVELRQQSKSFRQIAEQLGISHQHARTMVQEGATGTDLTIEFPPIVIGKDGKRRPAKNPVIHVNSVKEVGRAIDACLLAGPEYIPQKPIELKRMEKIAREAVNSKRREQEVKDFRAGQVDLWLGDFATRGLDILDNSVDLVFSDPPYDKASLPLWDHLGILAKRVLKPGGLLLCYSGNLFIPQILNMLGEHLMYLWQAAIYHSGPTKLVPAVNIHQAWKPILMFYKPPLHKWWRPPLDMVSGGESKENHAWEQSVAEAAHYISAFCPKGGTLLDPMTGSGTSVVAGLQSGLGLKCIGIEIDKAAYITAQQRIQQAQTDLDSRRETA